MARPRIIRLEDGGEIILRNVAKDTADKVGKIVGKGAKESEEEEEITPPAPTVVNFSNMAIGVAQENHAWVAYEVSFDPLTSEARVTKKHVCGERDSVEEKFKILAFQYDLI